LKKLFLLILLFLITEKSFSACSVSFGTPTCTVTNTFTLVPTWTLTPTFTPTGSNTATKTNTPIGTITYTFTRTPINTATPTFTITPTFTKTLVPTFTNTITNTITATPTLKGTLTYTPTNTVTITFTPTITCTTCNNCQNPMPVKECAPITLAAGTTIVIQNYGTPIPSLNLIQNIPVTIIGGSPNFVLLTPNQDYKFAVITLHNYNLNDAILIGWEMLSNNQMGSLNLAEGDMPFYYPDGTFAGENGVDLIVPNPSTSSRFTIVIPMDGASKIFIKQDAGVSGMNIEGQFTNNWNN
jgi:hypothetical protein